MVGIRRSQLVQVDQLVSYPFVFKHLSFTQAEIPTQGIIGTRRVLLYLRYGTYDSPY